MDHPCPNCHAILKSEKSYNKHLAIEHESYSDGTEVKPWTIESLIRVEDQTLFLLYKFPACRDKNDGELDAKALQYFIKATIWDSNKQLYFMNGKDDGIEHQRLKWALAQLKKYERARRKHQERDKKLYHKKAIDGTWPIVVEHRCIQPSPTQQSLAESSEEAYRHYYSPIRSEHI